MASVTHRIKEIKQPRGGYIKPSQFKSTKLDDGKTLNLEENISPSITGMTVDYLTRFMIGTPAEEAFKISLLGAVIAESESIANQLLKEINGLDNKSIINACKLTTFDVWYRSPSSALYAKGYDETNPDSDTIENIKVLVERSIDFFKKYGPVTQDGFDFYPYGYTLTVNAGDGDFLTSDTLWDFKVSKNKITSAQTLQLLMYWIMGQHSGQAVFKTITKLGIFNPRLNTVHLLDMADIPQSLIQTVEDEVICY